VIFFSSGLARVAEYPAGTSFGPRTLVNYELVWILEGQVRWMCEGNEHALGPGDLAVARPGMRDWFVWDPDRTTRHAYLHFDLDLDGAEANFPSPSSWPALRRLAGDDPVRPLLRYLLWLPMAPEAERWSAEVLHLVLGLFSGGPLQSDTLGPGLSPPTVSALTWLRECWVAQGVGPVRLEALARAANVTPGYLCRRFRAEIGASPVATVDLARLSNAAELLARTDMTVSEIARAVGFGDQFHFSRRFKATFGLSPRAYRATDPGPPVLGASDAEAIRRAAVVMLS
jgi:AraC-like DNA-binding protein